MKMKGALEVHALLAAPAPSSVSIAHKLSIYTPHQRKNFYANGLHWVFYHRKGMNYRVSRDGLTWSEPIKLAPVEDAHFFSLYFDGTYLHYVYHTDMEPPPTPATRTFYRKGIPNSDGTITWVADEQIVFDGIYICFPTICVDSYGYPWIGFYYWIEEPWKYVPGVIKSSRNDGVWETAPGFPYFLNPEETYRAVGVTPLTGGKIYALYYRALSKLHMPGAETLPILGKLWDGVSWGPEENVSASKVSNEEWEMVSYLSVGDNVHVVFLKDLTYEIIHIERDRTGWKPEKVVAQASNRSSPVISYSPSTDTIYCFWIENNKIYFKRYSRGAWDTVPTEWVVEQPVSVPGYSPSYKDLYGSKIMCSERDQSVAWLLLDGTDNPWWEECDALLRYNHLRV